MADVCQGEPVEGLPSVLSAAEHKLHKLYLSIASLSPLRSHLANQMTGSRRDLAQD